MDKKELKDYFNDYTDEQLEETIKCMNFLINMEFNKLVFNFDDEQTEFYHKVEKELTARNK